jgi:hypothetical protein
MDRVFRSVAMMDGNGTTTVPKVLYSLIPTTSTRIPLHFHDGESSDQRTGRSAYARFAPTPTTTTTTTRQLLSGRVITLRRGSWLLFHCRRRRRRRRRRNRVTTRTQKLGRRGGSGMSPLFLLLLSVCCICQRCGRICDHVWREDIVECYAAVVSSFPCLLPVRAITTGGRGRSGVICRGGGGCRVGGALGSTAFTAHWVGDRASVGGGRRKRL